MQRFHFKKIAYLISLATFPLISLAQQGTSGNYIPLTKIGNYISGTGTTLSTYLNSMFKLGVGIASGLAVIMIIIGGIEYMSTDAMTGKKEGISKITAAVWGLIIALCSYILLVTINPALLNTNLVVSGVNGEVNTVPASVGSLNLPGRGEIPTDPGEIVGGTGGGNGILNDFESPDGSRTIEYNNGLTAYIDANGSSVLVDQNGNEVSGTSINGNLVAIDFDGRVRPNFTDSYLAGTSYRPNGQSLDSFSDPYVAVPTSSGIPMGTPVLVTNTTNGQSVWAVAGDRGASGWGEMSAAAGQAVGIWSPGMGNNARSNQSITFTIYGPCPRCR